MSENTENKKKKPSSKPHPSGKKKGTGKGHGHSPESSRKGGAGVNLKKKKGLAGRTVEMSSGQQIRIEDIMNEHDETFEAPESKPSKPKRAPQVKTEDGSEPDFHPEPEIDPGDFSGLSVSGEINWRKQIKSIVIWTFSVILLALTFFPGENLWNIIHEFLLGILGFKAFFWAGLMIFYGYLMTKQVDETETLDMIRPAAGIILLLDVLGYILIQSNGYRNVYNEFSFDPWALVNQMLKDGTKIGGSGLLSGAIGELFIIFAGKAGAAIIVSILLIALIMVMTHTGPIDLFNQGKRLIRTLLNPDFYRNLMEADTASYKTVFDSDDPMDEYDIIDDEAPDVDVYTEDDSGAPAGEAEGGHDGDAPDEGEESLSDIVKAVSLKKKKKLTKAEEIKAESEEISKQVKSGEGAPDEKVEKEYKYPTVRLLIPPKNTGSANELREELTETAEKLIRTLDEYSVKASISDISRGPTVTRYEIKPAPGVKINKIKNLSNDIALRLAAQSIRIEAPIPGKSAVGIEIPNKNKQMVRIREILGSTDFIEAKGALTVALGKDIEGNIVLCDLSRMPHLLIAGSTGSGKSVCVNSMLISLLYKYSPADVRMVLIDPKSVEFDMYNGIPHLLVPVVCEPKKAAGALQWAVSEMLKRYSMLKEHGVRNIDGYNRLAEQTGEFDKLCRIVIVIDEMADLMIASPKEVEDAIARLAAMARAAGMYMVLATQRPSVDVITGTIKNNIPSRIALAVSSQVDSRTILDEGGAENLIGYGDMLYHPMGSSKHIRVQGCFVDDAEVDRVIRFVKQNGLAEYDDSIADEIERNSLDSSGEGAAEFEGKDEFFEKAVEVVTEAGQASTSMLQRRLGVGYARAGRIIDQLEEHGIIGPHEGSKPRAVLITRTQWMEMTMSRTHAGKNDPLVRSHSEFASQTLDAGHEDITARQSEFFNTENNDEFDGEEDFLADIPEYSDDSEPENSGEEIAAVDIGTVESPAEASAGEESAEDVIDVELAGTEQEEEIPPSSGQIPDEKDFTDFLFTNRRRAVSQPDEESLAVSEDKKTPEKKAAPPAEPTAKKKPAQSSPKPRDLSIFFDDDSDEIDDFFDFSGKGTGRSKPVQAAPEESAPPRRENQLPEKPVNGTPDDLPPWEDYPSEDAAFREESGGKGDESETGTKELPAQPGPGDDGFSVFSRSESLPVRSVHTRADKDGDDGFSVFSRPDSPPAQSVHTRADKESGDGQEDDDFFDDVMSSPWIKKL